MNIFERASRQKLRFASTFGDLTTEQLWDLPLTTRGDRSDLDKLARAIHGELKGIEEVSFVETSPNPRSAELELKLDLLKHVIASKKSDIARAEAAQANAQRREKLTAALAQKQDAALAAMSEDDIKAELAKIGS